MLLPRRLSVMGTVCLTLLASSFASASDNLRVSGFGNVSVIKSGTENLGFKYDLSKEALFDEWSLKPGSSFGLQLNANINDQFDAVIQGVLQDRLDNNLNKTITWAFLRYRPTQNITVRAGRIATPIYMLSEYRDVGFAYLWTKPITDFYSAIPVTYIDGGDIAYSAPLGDGIFEARLFGGSSEVTIETIFEPHNVTLSPIIGGKLTYSLEQWLFSSVAATTKAKEGEPAASLTSSLSGVPNLELLWPGASRFSNDFKLSDTRISYYSLGALYETGDWNVQSELSYTDAEWPFFTDLAAGYLSVGRTLNSNTFYGFASKSKTIGSLYALSAPSALGQSVSQIADAYQLIGSNLNARFVDQETFGMGVRLDISPQISLKGQIERTWLKNDHIGGWLTSINGLSAAVPSYIDTYSVSLSFVF
ncbi:porin [Enterovibrio sp. ZSDZ35]|uniref:Porin n=1 Tax=Enterovibrio qingdaonensis TaxID=2899818 RepID=A0ABT5QIC6_9GAMM|nr:porin [Enterovibrio sp. ZSDZ35]MDD1780740.1 porin [Enterovibrio sp. ZSDZ35]